MLTYTPGPWFSGDCEDGENIWIGPNPVRVVAKCSKFHPRANIRLLTAAPDLLMLALQYRDDLRRPPAVDSVARRVAALDAVIFKATEG